MIKPPAIRRRAWLLFDFANSIVIINGSLYISQWVSDQGVADFWYGAVFAMSTIALALTSPAVGLVVDRASRRVPWLALHSVGIAAAALTISALASDTSGNSWAVAGVLGAFFLMNFLYQTSLIFYNAMIAEVAGRAGVATTSGLGEGLGHVGSIAGILLFLPVAAGALSPWVPAGGIFSVGPAGVASLVAVLAVLFFAKEPSQPRDAGGETLDSRYRRTIGEFRDARARPEIRLFLLAYYLFADAILSVQLFVAIYLKKMWAMESNAIALTVLVALVTAAIGAMVSGPVATRFGVQRSLLWVVGGWLVGLVGMALSSNYTMFMIFFTPCGLLFGGVWALSRSWLALMAPKGQEGHYFGLYAVAERFSAIVGPLLWGGTVALFAGTGTFAYRAAMLSMALLLAAGFALATRLPEIRNVPE